MVAFKASKETVSQRALKRVCMELTFNLSWVCKEGSIKQSSGNVQEANEVL